MDSEIKIVVTKQKNINEEQIIVNIQNIVFKEIHNYKGLITNNKQILALNTIAKLYNLFLLQNYKKNNSILKQENIIHFNFKRFVHSILLSPEIFFDQLKRLLANTDFSQQSLSILERKTTSILKSLSYISLPTYYDDILILLRQI